MYHAPSASVMVYNRCPRPDNGGSLLRSPSLERRAHALRVVYEIKCLLCSRTPAATVRVKRL